ncbi:transcriptional regulator [Rubrobacter taiwanensis]|jgi:DNA-binding transcriptional ArsR family regulator|uniref:Transcriptional regulator n=1 Tax=Rubrobacter taiwanensis TaxID=185139 RepID=A0A4V2NVU7_9ACTN|nr:transcriptional regulator [Rubrobacter taiwanensis]TCJ14872.1 transcriptional regulator [Rubrobacter taiwanensis]
MAGKPDYELDDVLEVRDPAQFKAAGDPIRHRIISLLSERAATTSQLAEALGQPKGNIGHHLKVLERAGLVRVVRTRQVRAITEKYYGRTARLFNFRDMHDVYPEDDFRIFREVMGEWDRPEPGEPRPDLASTLRHARIPASKAEEFNRKVLELADEFSSYESVPGERVYGFLAAVYLTDLPELPEEEE